MDSAARLTRRLVPALLALGAVNIVCPVAAFSAWPPDSSAGAPIWTLGGRVEYPKAVTDGKGGAIIVWEIGQSSPYYPDIHAQHVLANGMVDPSWPANGLAVCVATDKQDEVAIIADGSGGAFVAWQDNRTLSSDIYAQHILAGGEVDPRWPVNGRALCTAVWSQSHPRMISDGATGAIVVWDDRRAFYDSLDIYAQRVLEDGSIAPGWPTDGAPVCTFPHRQEGPSIASDGLGGAIILWGDVRAVVDWDLYAQHLLPDGTLDPTWPAGGLPVATGIRDQLDARMLPAEDGGVVFAYHDFTGGFAHYDVRAQRVLLSGAVDPEWPQGGRLVTQAPQPQFNAQVVSDGAGGALIAWQDNRDDPLSDIYAQHLLADGEIDPLWPPDGRALCRAANDQIAEQVASDGAGGAIVTWFDFRSATGPDVYAQRVLANGALDPAWPEHGRAVCVSSAQQTWPTLTSDGHGGAVIVWQQAGGVFAQHIGSNGVLGDPGVLALEGQPSNGLTLGPIYPNPWTGGSLKIAFVLPEGGPAAMELFDVTGRTVVSRIVETSGGPSELSIERRALPAAGLYWVRLRQNGLVRVARVALLD